MFHETSHRREQERKSFLIAAVQHEILHTRNVVMGLDTK
jgi:hypothetical protein